ncbi:hypothetical protein [Methylocaldum sp. RMAD-M]|jgi:hypothetical protein|uniref:hypothetical protein n=1 Tax=Methylocaldum sp. RMAD-M TaxID=2806557 RepID=UPI001AE4F448|nr:hypothetical protein [Methylocaldum sp. RMAD-M]MBP1152562.1 hypothetical protein [Methylocaldum sp. RMAD-M]
MASTAQEALIAELLGDVGKLHDEVKALRESLPAIVADLNERTTALQTAIAGLGDEAVQATVRAHIENATEKIVTQALRDAAATVLTTTLQVPINRLESSAFAVYKAAKAMQRSAREQVAILVGVSLLAGAVGGAAAAATASYLKDHLTHARAPTIEHR